MYCIYPQYLQIVGKSPQHLWHGRALLRNAEGIRRQLTPVSSFPGVDVARKLFLLPHASIIPAVLGHKDPVLKGLQYSQKKT